MGIARTLRDVLADQDVDYQILPHQHTNNSMHTAEASRIPGDQIAKSVILEDETGYLMAVVPATHHVDIGKLSRQLDRRLGLATEKELARLFEDCDLGAIPPIGDAYNMEMVIDECLSQNEAIYFEAGDHADLIRMSWEDYEKIMGPAMRGRFSHHL